MILFIKVLFTKSSYPNLHLIIDINVIFFFIFFSIFIKLINCPNYYNNIYKIKMALKAGTLVVLILLPRNLKALLARLMGKFLFCFVFKFYSRNLLVYLFNIN